MQRLLYSIFISFFLIVSCAKSKPSGVVSESKITDILTEVSLVDGYLNTLPSDSARRVMPVLYDKLFKKYKLDSAEFVQNLDYYFGDPNLTDKIYTQVNKNLGVYEREFHVEDSVKMAFQQDSINRVHYFQRVFSKVENLRFYNEHDTGFRNYYEFTQRVMNNSNLDFLSRNLSLSPTPNLAILDKDSLANFTRHYKSPFVFVDSTKIIPLDLSKYKVNSERFLNKVSVYVPSGNYYQRPEENQIKEVILDRSVPRPEVLPTPLDSVSSNQNKDSLRKVLDTRREMLRNDRLVKPVSR